MNSALSGAVQAEQVIFTSLRTPMGEGYRIVATSPGVLPDEKREITQRSPSHGTLLDDSPHTWGLLCYPLASGRTCCALARHAGREHTARGGNRVHSHMVLLDAAGFKRFDHNGRCVVEALKAVVGDEPVVQPPDHLETLALPASDRGTTVYPAEQLSGDDANRLRCVLSALFGEQQLIVLGLTACDERLWLALEALPAVLRKQVSLSAGLKYSPSRPFQVVVLGNADGQAQRLCGRNDLLVVDWQGQVDRKPCSQDLWLDHVYEAWTRGGFADIARLTNLIDGADWQLLLPRIVTLHRDLKAVRAATPEALRMLQCRYRDRVGAAPVEQQLIDTLHRQINHRREQLEALARTELAANKAAGE